MPNRRHNSNVAINHFASRALSNLVATLRFAVATAYGLGRLRRKALVSSGLSRNGLSRRGEAAHTALRVRTMQCVGIIPGCKTHDGGERRTPAEAHSAPTAHRGPMYCLTKRRPYNHGTYERQCCAVQWSRSRLTA